ncbi:MAG TPA: carboxypeptidase regulatory-like domain-containing protein [Pyrinomonadaceae bacterium]|nr:carboxypeptidase regulatory-like domain-containing protein [Pyrinomonadaceae bacterium]
MINRFARPACLVLFILCVSMVALAQITTSGRLAGVVTDSVGALVPNAEITVTNNDTKAEYKANANDEGGWSIPSVPNGTYTVKINAPNFKTTVLQNVKVDTAQVTTANATLEPGEPSAEVVIQGGGEILQTESANVATTIAGRQITELPFVTRDALQLVLTLPGVQTPGVPRTSSINGLPKGSVNMTLDGVNIQDNFLRSSDGFFTTIQMKSDAVQEVTVSTAVPGAESGGEGAAQIKGTTRSGSSEFHGGAFWQYRSPNFNSNYYFNNVDGLPRDALFLRQMGGHVGGPILIPGLVKSRNRAFFFLNFEEFRLPQAYGSLSAVGNIFILTDTARTGVFTYKDSGGTVRTVNLITLAQSKGFSQGIDPKIAAGLALVNTGAHSAGALTSRITSANDYNRLNYQFQDPGNNTRRFPTARFDWNITKNQHFEFIHNYQFYYSLPDAVNGQNSVVPGEGIVVGNPGGGSIYRDSFSYAAAHRWTINSVLVNEIRATSGGNGTSVFTREFAPGLFGFWNGYAVTGGTYLGAQGNGTGAFYNRRSTSRRNTPTKGLSDNINYVKGTHTFNFGASFLRINSFTEAVSTQVVNQVVFGLATGDPINTGSTGIFTTTNFPGASTTQLGDARALYTYLVGRVSSIARSASLDGSTQKYIQDAFREYNHQNEFAFYAQDSWKIRPNLTLNYGLRWELEPSAINDNNAYTRNTFAGIYGVSGVGNLFSPGTFTGSPTSYRLLTPGEKGFETRKHDFAPSFGFAYTPNFKSGFMKTLVGDNGQTVLRGGYSIAFTREGFSAYTSMFGSNEGGTVTLSVSPSLTPTIFPNGGVFYNQGLGQTCFTPATCTTGFPALTPPADTSKYPFTPGALSGGSFNDFDLHLKAGYTQSFSFGIQRSLGKDTVVEARWVRTRGTHLWRQMELNEVNIFENGFLNQFKTALAALKASPGGNSNYGPGFIATAIGSQTDALTIQRLLQGQAGAIANSIAFTSSRMNNLINAGLVPFTTLPSGAQVGSCDPTRPAASQNCKVSNYFVVNPQTTAGTFLMTQGTDTNFNALQIEVRRRLSAGLLVQGSYQFGKALSNAFVSSSSVFSQPRTLRNPGLDRNYSPWDIRHSFKLDYIYELPFGHGKTWLNSSNGLVNRVVGNWQIGGVTRIQSGPATLLTSGGRATVNQNDAGLFLHNLTKKQLQSLVQIRKSPSGVVYWLPQSLIDNTISAFTNLNGIANDPSAPYIGPPNIAGVLGERIVLFGPPTARFDFNIMKRIPISERFNLEGRVSFLNAFNRANFYIGDADSTIRSASAASTSFGQTRSAYRDITVSGTNDPGGRLIEWQIRLNF